MQIDKSVFNDNLQKNQTHLTMKYPHNSENLIWAIVLTALFILLLLPRFLNHFQKFAQYRKNSSILKWFFDFFLRTRTAQCGHQTTKRGLTTNKQGETFYIRMPAQEDGSYEYCLSCIGEMSITCCECGKSIDIGDPVTLVSYDKQDSVSKHATVHTEGGRNSYVCCLRRDCGDPIFRSGFWMPPGKVQRMASPFELCLSSGKPVIISDLGDPNDTGRII